MKNTVFNNMIIGMQLHSKLSSNLRSSSRCC